MFKLMRRVGPKGQIVLPKDVRDSLGLKTGSGISISAETDRIVIEKADPLRAVEEFCTLPQGIKKLSLSGKDIKKIIEAQYASR